LEAAPTSPGSAIARGSPSTRCVVAARRISTADSTLAAFGVVTRNVAPRATDAGTPLNPGRDRNMSAVPSSASAGAAR
jgi:hypothetical protein